MGLVPGCITRSTSASIDASRTPWVISPAPIPRSRSEKSSASTVTPACVRRGTCEPRAPARVASTPFCTRYTVTARPRAVPVRKAQALLAYLALRAGRAHARDSLTALLWADTPDKQARQNLRQTMVRLRRALDGGRRPALVAQGDTVTLNPGALDLD